METDGSESASLCLRCARLGKTCCQNSQIFLTLGDVKRIAQAVGAEDFHVFAAPSDPDYLVDSACDPVWSRIFSANGKRRILAAKPNGDCLFLGDRGCRLSLDARPLICRLYPYDYVDSTIKGVNGHLCPEPERGSPALLLASLAMNREQAEEWRAAIYREIREEFPG
ncbi:MAG: YkgJ family cysteine cluster protein [Planctomycetota bacterium]|jgi:Fe-S-cluster containining protein|nr:YkgJ family cysteine cluster protein [Planctomycetota bacterium]